MAERKTMNQHSPQIFKVRTKGEPMSVGIVGRDLSGQISSVYVPEDKCIELATKYCEEKRRENSEKNLCLQSVSQR